MIEDSEKAVLKSIGNSVRKKRMMMKISQAQLAFEISSDARHIRRIENGEVNLSFLTLLRISNVLDISLEKLMEKN